MNEPRILLLNADLSSAVGPQLLQGFSGKTYAVSRWCPAQNCHAVEMSLAEYEACRDDLRRAVHLMMRRWYPKFIVPERPAAALDFERGYAAGFAGEDLPTESSRAWELGWETGLRVSIDLVESDGTPGEAQGGKGALVSGPARKTAMKAKKPGPSSAASPAGRGRKPEVTVPVAVHGADEPEISPR